MSPNTWQLIVTLLQNGKSCHQVAAQLYVSYSMVQRVYTSIKDSLPQHLGGCPRKLTTCDQRLLARKVTSGVADTAPQLKKLLDLDVSTQTVRNALKKAGLKSAVKQKKPFLSKAHQRRRLEFALRHQHWTLEDWSRVVWSDESKVNRLGSDGRSWVWKKPGSALKEQHVAIISHLFLSLFLLFQSALLCSDISDLLRRSTSSRSAPPHIVDHMYLT
jgi:transposase